MPAARNLGVVAAGGTAAFLVFVALVAPGAAFVAAPLAALYVGAGFVVARARRWWATGTAVAVAAVTALLTYLTTASPESVALDVLILGTCTVLAFGAAVWLIRGGDEPPSHTEDPR